MLTLKGCVAAVVFGLVAVVLLAVWEEYRRTHGRGRQA
jgi:hypothetical protein